MTLAEQYKELLYEGYDGAAQFVYENPFEDLPNWNPGQYRLSCIARFSDGSIIAVGSVEQKDSSYEQQLVCFKNLQQFYEYYGPKSS